MKIFQTLKKYFEIIGVSESRLSQPTVFDYKNVVGLLLCGQYSLLTCAYFLFECETFAEYTDSYYIFTTVFGANFNYVFVVFNMKKVFAMMKTMECIIEKRRCCQLNSVFYFIVYFFRNEERYFKVHL